MGKLKITQIRSATSRGAKQQGTIKALGLRRIGQEVVVDDKPEIRGMVEKVKHLVEVEESDQ
ncbi:MAG: 50S ribosomal protein L30 [Actinomycetota bacterium]|nr:50S ribosomal protein L30 [Actinomycetota bacterium]